MGNGIVQIAEALIYRVINLFGPPRWIVCDEAAESTSAIIQAILTMLNCRLKVISPYNHGSSKCERQIKTISTKLDTNNNNTVQHSSCKLNVELIQ